MDRKQRVTGEEVLVTTLLVLATLVLAVLV